MKTAWTGALCALLLSIPVLAFGADPPLRVGRIHVETFDVFTPEEASAGWPYRALNAVHVHTRESTLRKSLLFHEGDAYDPAKLAETERNLRRLRFIKSASVTALPSADGTVDVDVRTQDTWTTEPTLSISRSGSVTSYGASIIERNLAGTGREVELTYYEGVDRITRYFAFEDPNLLGPYWSGTFLHAFNSDGWQDLGGIQKAFSSVSMPRAGALLVDVSSSRARIYHGGRAVSEYRRDHRGYLAEFGTALARSATTARRLFGGFQIQEDRFAATPGRADDPRPPSRKYRYAFLRADLVRTDLVKLDYVDRDARIDDFELGDRISILAGLSPTLFGVDRTTGVVGATASRGWRIGEGTLLLPQLALDSRVGATSGNTIAAGSLRFVHRFHTKLTQTLVSRLEMRRGWDLDPDVQFFADGSSAVRGYRLREYEGDRAAVLNVEHRVFSGLELFRMVAPGAAVFFDAGIAASSDKGIRAAAVKRDVGVGLRLAFPRASVHTVFRLDIAFPLDPDREGRREPLVSFSSSQAF
jgi:hypothetical protein